MTLPKKTLSTEDRQLMKEIFNHLMFRDVEAGKEILLIFQEKSVPMGLFKEVKKLIETQYIKDLKNFQYI